jgi:Na+-transporting methylmalonyl-CoA/oxaloacetate decarboxylase gamma subunit
VYPEVLKEGAEFVKQNWFTEALLAIVAAAIRQLWKDRQNQKPPI